MAELIIIGQSVGTNAVNLAPDVAKIGAALVAVGPERGGLSSLPLTMPALIEAIGKFQSFQKLRVIDGRIDPNGSTLRRINELLNADSLPAPPVGRTGAVRRIPPPPGCSDFVERTVWIPVEWSLISEMVFKWGGVTGKGKTYYFELDEDVVPNWFGVLVPDGLTDFEHIHIFFHPTPGQAGYKDQDYKSKNGWSGVFHYLSDDMAVQFCGANTGQVLIMPLLTGSAAGTCGILPERWESIIGQMLGQIKSGDMSLSAPPQNISSVVVSSFSAGIAYSAAFRTRAAGLGSKLIGVIDFDGIISSYKSQSQALLSPAVRMWQTGSLSKSLFEQSMSNTFPLPQSRWTEGPYSMAELKNPKKLHGAIPQTMMYIAAQRTGVR